MLEPVVKQLRTIFPYRNYQLLSTMLMRSQQGKPAETSGMILVGPTDAKTASHPSHYFITYGSATVTAEGTRPAVHLNNFRFGANIPVAANPGSNIVQHEVYSRVDIKSDVDLREGQKVVVGQTDIGTGNAALFIVLSAKLVD